MITNPIEILIYVARVFEDVGARYVFVGSIASSHHGLPRATNDVDLVSDLSLGQAAPFIKAVEKDFYVNETSVRRALQTHHSFNLIHFESSLKVDVFIPPPNGFGWQSLLRRQAEPIDESRKVFIATAEDTVLAKLDWFVKGGGTSERQWSDVSGIIKFQRDKLDYDYLREWAARLKVDDLLQRVLDEARS
ncbi:MAG: hypothetical protein MSG64_00400 [Pyrinomonadaceae bacterium MAG19_C2-C3]|nr:hypothetical protein [Pyrinomonadaceae bacterium MAG19_C2-C3]